MAEEKPEEQTAAGAGGDAVDVDQTDGAVTEAHSEADSGNDADAADPDEAPVDFEAELEVAKDVALRAQADAMNAQRRAEQEVEKARKFALERFCGDLLSVVDNLERALESSGDEPGSAARHQGAEAHPEPIRRADAEEMQERGASKRCSCGIVIAMPPTASSGANLSSALVFSSLRSRSSRQRAPARSPPRPQS